MIKVEKNLSQFKEYVMKRRCFCFGCGIQGIRMINIMENWGCSNNLISFTDNNRSKIGSKITNGRLSYKVVSLEELIADIHSDDLMIVTCADVVNIISQLEEYVELKEIECCSLGEIGLQELIVSDYDEVIKESEVPMIPKIIHYFWCGGEKSDWVKKNVEQWRRLCPDYEIREWNEYNYDISKNQYMKQAYDKKKWGFVPDYARLDIIYQYGGIYIDTDVELVKRPDELLYQKCFGISDGSFILNLGSGFGAVQGVGIIKELRDYYDTVEFVDTNGNINVQPTSYHAYQVIRRYGYHVNDHMQSICEMNIYPMIMAGTNTYTMQMRITPKTFFLHYGTATWLNDNHKKAKERLSGYSKGYQDVINYAL